MPTLVVQGSDESITVSSMSWAAIVGTAFAHAKGLYETTRGLRLLDIRGADHPRWTQGIDSLQQRSLWRRDVRIEPDDCAKLAAGLAVAIGLGGEVPKALKLEISRLPDCAPRVMTMLDAASRCGGLEVA